MKDTVDRVLGRDISVVQGRFAGGQLAAMDPDAFDQEHTGGLGNESFSMVAVFWLEQQDRDMRGPGKFGRKCCLVLVGDAGHHDQAWLCVAFEQRNLLGAAAPDGAHKQSVRIDTSGSCPILYRPSQRSLQIGR